MNALLSQRLLAPSSILAAGASLFFLAPFVSVGDTQVPHTFQSGTKARAAEVNANFGALMDAVDDLRPANRVVVATDGGDFDSVADALASITDATANNPYVVWVAPGVYSETDLCLVPSFVSVVGASSSSTTVTSARSSSAFDGNSSTLELQDLAGLRGLTIENGSASQAGVAVYGDSLSRDTRIEDCVMRATGAGGTGHYAVLVEESDLTLVDCFLKVAGASTVNAAFGSKDTLAAFAQPLLMDCTFEAMEVTNGLGLELSSTAALVEGCRVEGWLRAISTATNGATRVRDSEIKALGLNPVYEQSGSSSILSGTTYFIGGNPVGLASQFKYAWCIKANHDPVVNGFGSTIQ